MNDFSGISTDKLKYAVEHYDGWNSSACERLSCNRSCPFYDKYEECPSNKQERHELFKEELNRREKDMNKQPILQTGMMIQFKERGAPQNNWAMVMFNRFENNQQLMFSDGQTIGIKAVEDCFKICVFKDNGFHSFFRNNINGKDISVLWSRKSDKDIEIEEIQKEMDKLNKRMEGLKSDN